MRFSCDYNTLLSTVTSVSGVVEDSLVHEEDKNIIFQLKKSVDETVARVLGVTTQLIYKEPIDSEKYQLDLENKDYEEDGYAYFQLRSKDLIPYLNSYKSIRKTYVEEVIFEFERGMVKCTVVERNNEPSENETMRMRGDGTYDAFMEKRIISHWMFDNIVIRPTKFPLINMEVESDELIDIPKNMFSCFIKNLIGNMENSTGAYGTMIFVDDFVMVSNKAYNNVMKVAKPISTVFQGIGLHYRYVNFINKVLLLGDIYDDSLMQVCRSGRFIYIKSDTIETFITYVPKITKVKSIIDMFKRGDYIELDRVYVKDVLKRFSLLNNSIEIQVDAGNHCLHLKNTKFSQDIEYLSAEGIESINGLKFTIMPSIMNSAIIGEDSTMITSDEDGNMSNESIFINFCDTAGGDGKSRNIAFTDTTNIWFTLVRAKTY